MFSAVAAFAAVLAVSAVAQDSATCAGTGERCAGAPGRPFVEWVGCCGTYPQVDCLPHPMEKTDEDKYWGRFCLEKDGAAMPASEVPESPPVQGLALSKNSGSSEGAPSAGGGGLWDDRAPLATYPVSMKSTLLPDRYTADASAHVVDGKLFAWTSHDLKVDFQQQDETQYMMRDYTLMGFSEDMSVVEDYGNVLPIETVPWASRMMWAPDCVCKKDMGCFLYFPAQDKNQVFKIGVAHSDTVYGPYTADPEPIPGSFSIDPAVFTDDDGTSYLMFGGDWGGQLQGYQSGSTYDKNAPRPSSGDALKPRMAKMTANMKMFDGAVMEMDIVDGEGNLLQANDQQRRFFEGAWMHKIGDRYYLSYSTGETHKLVYATSQNINGPWTFAGEIMSPPQGWTTHHSITKGTDGKWYLFYHDAKQSGQDSLRNVKMQELKMDGWKIIPMQP